MKILFINEYGSWGGAEKIFFYVVRELRKQNKDILCLLGADGVLKEKLLEIGVDVKLYRKQRKELKDNSIIIKGKRVPNFFAIIKNYIDLKVDSKIIEKEIEEFNPELIYLNNLRPLVIFNNIKNSNSTTKIIWHEHGYQRSKIRQFILDRKLLKNVNKVICVSEHVYNTHLDIVKPKLLVINNGIDDIDFNKKNNNRVVEFIQPAFITRWKGQNTVLEAVNLLVNKYEMRNFKVKFLGSPRSEDDNNFYRELTRYTKEKNLNQYVEFLGFRNDAIKLMGEADIILSSSQEHDPFPTILLESCVLGKPIISSNAGGSKDIVSHEENGLIFEMKNSEELAKHMLKLLKNKEILNEFGAKSREIYIEKFTIDVFNKNIVSFIDNI